MKKFLSLLLAALMVFSMAAVAETAEPAEAAQTQPGGAIVNGSDIIFRIYDEEGNVTEFPIQDFSYFAAIDTVNGVNLMFEMDQGQDDVLLSALCRIADGKLQYCMSGVDRTFEIDLSDVPGADTDTLADVLRAELPKLLENSMEPISAVEIPVIDTAAFFDSYVTETTEADGVTTAEVVIPAEDVKAMLDMIVSIAKLSAGSVEQTKAAFDLVEELIKNLTLEIKGTITTSEDGQNTTVGLYAVNEGTVSDDALVTLSLNSAENLLSVEALTTAEDGTANTVGNMSIASDPETNSMVFSVEINDLATLSVMLDQENDLQNVYVSANVLDKNATSQFSYGTVDGKDYVTFTESVDDVGSMSGVVTGSLLDDHTYNGDVDITMDFKGLKFGMSANSTVSLFELGLADLEMPAEITTELPTEDEMETALNPFVEYICDLLGIKNTAAEEAPAEEAADEEAPAEEEADEEAPVEEEAVEEEAPAEEEAVEEEAPAEEEAVEEEAPAEEEAVEVTAA